MYSVRFTARSVAATIASLRLGSNLSLLIEPRITAKDRWLSVLRFLAVGLGVSLRDNRQSSTNRESPNLLFKQRQTSEYNTFCRGQSVAAYHQGTPFVFSRCLSDILGLLLDLEKQYLVFYLNGQPLPSYKQLFSHARSGFFAAASFMSFQQCEFNFGARPFRYPPSGVHFCTFNQFGHLKPEEKIVLPRHKKLALMKQFVVSDDACTLCFDRVANTLLRDCGHRGFCEVCAIQLERCPICRKEIAERVRCSSSSTSPASSLTTASTAALASTTVSGSPGPKSDVLSTPPGPVLIPTPVV
ncbi:hypothetical protein RRG08_026298 [Elysia crispata]|uniref:RING-type domain-containing protein n=1 Tax=Elysia crispata TaxID=231223 RepID=A0AAE0ZAQ2_9GAST|nr:hypothetical protein RRG08_026298 [Elysia crispata]